MTTFHELAKRFDQKEAQGFEQNVMGSSQENFSNIEQNIHSFKSKDADV